VEQLGDTLPAIARSLTAGFPPRGRVLTAERAPGPLDALRRGAAALETELTVVDPATVSDDELAAFGPFAFRDNLALALAAAEAVGVDRDTALAGMRAAPADPGAARLAEHRVDGREVTWVDLFAVNDPESAVEAVDKAVAWAGDGAGVVLLLNNRADRQPRALQFAGLAAERLPHDVIALAGAYAGPVAERLAQRGVERGAIRRIGDVPAEAAERVVRELAAAPGTDRVLLIGLANLHTAVGEALQRRLAPEAAGG
jgi:poly-gamma-glutamate synthase PgsB/CapB